MKLSLRWVCDHLHIDWKKVDVTALVAWFNTTVAEIESVEKITTDLSAFSLAIVQSIQTDGITVSVPAVKKTVSLPVRSDAVLQACYLVKKVAGNYVWAQASEFCAEKEGLLPAFQSPAKTISAATLEKHIEATDYIFDIDNKSITHRPDLWSHRGFAREIAPFLKTTLRDEKEFLAPLPVKSVKNSFQATKQVPFSFFAETSACKRFACIYFKELSYAPSDLTTAVRLMRVGQRTIDYLVDATNYVMFDLGQPLHAFDAATLDASCGGRMAKKGEQLTLLGGHTLTLRPTDIVIADDKKVLTLAGIKGGSGSGVSQKTKSVLLESAVWDGGVIRQSSAHHSLRTEASARFEKELDPRQNVIALQRFVQLLKKGSVPFECSSSIISLGDVPKPTTITVAQSFIENRLGTTIKQGVVTKLLEGIGFTVKTKKTAHDTVFTVTVPTFRATKDVKRAEDIVEEVGRLVGYTTIPEKLPVFETVPLALRQRAEKKSHQDPVPDWNQRILSIKQLFAFTGRMQELQSYAFLDNDFLKKINWSVAHPVVLANPLSEQRTTLVDSLVTPLLQAVSENSANHEQLAFFEWDRVWSLDAKHQKKVIERSSLAGVWYQRKGEIDFYELKDTLQNLFALLKMSVAWEACPNRPQWAHRYQVADLVCDGKVIGTAGKVKPAMMEKVADGDAFVFELQGDFLLSYAPVQKKIAPPAKYQGSFLDISMMAPIETQVAFLEQLIAHADKRITSVQLQDIFQKPEWTTEKSMTFRFHIEDPQQTVSREILDDVSLSVKKALVGAGVSIR